MKDQRTFLIRWRSTFVPIGIAWIAAFVLTVSDAPARAPFNRSLYEPGPSLDSWWSPEELNRDWLGRKILFRDAYLLAEGFELSQFYAASCPGGSLETSGNVLEARCPRVYLGKLPREEARRTLDQVGDRMVNVYLTVGQIVPAPFVERFGMLDARNGAWVEDGQNYFYIKPHSRVFRLPSDEEETASTDAAAASTPPAAESLAERPGQAATAHESVGDRPSTDEPSYTHPRFHLGYRFRPLRGHDSEGVRADFRELGRTSLLMGRTELRVETSVPDWYEIEGIGVWSADDVRLEGDRQNLCRSSVPPASCVADFGEAIAGRRFIIETRLVDGDGVRSTVAETFKTIDTHPGWIEPMGRGSYRERESVARHPPDEVVRLVRVETLVGRDEEKRVEYRVDLPSRAFSVSAAGLRGAVIKSVAPPAITRDAESTPVLIPIFISAPPHFLERERGEPALGWTDAYASADGLVQQIAQGLEGAAGDGVDAEYLVVDYAATGRLFGPFRLHPGRKLAAHQREHNRRTLDALAAHLRRLPPPEWRKKREGRWLSDIISPMQTLNDLYFREYRGLVGALLVTDGWNNPELLEPRFQHDLWPGKIEEVNRGLSSERVAALLLAFDEGRSAQDEAISQFLETADLNDAGALDRLAAFMRMLDPGGTSTLHPHTRDFSPQMDALIVPSAISLREQMQDMFNEMIRERFGGEIYRLFKLTKNDVEEFEEKLQDPKRIGGTLTLRGVIRRIYDQLRHSYVAVVEIPNEKHDGAPHDLTFKAVEARKTASGRTKQRAVEGRLRYMPYYTSSRSLSEKLPILAGSPFSFLRLLSAYELRNHWNNARLRGVVAARARDEGDPVIRRVLLESEIVIHLKRLQATTTEIPNARQLQADILDAYERLQALADESDGLADAGLAEDAALLARWYREDHPERFDGTAGDPGSPRGSGRRPGSPSARRRD